MTVLNHLKLKLIDFIGGLTIAKTLRYFKQQQHKSTEELHTQQQESLRTLFQKAISATRYYKQYDEYAEVPILNKQTVNARPLDFLSAGYKGKLISKSTSGSTGVPFHYYASASSQSALWAGLILSWETTGYQFGDRVAFIAGSALIKKGVKHNVFYKLMNIDLYPAAVMEDLIIESYIKNIRQRKTVVIYGYAMALQTIADYILRHRMEPLSSLRGIVCTAEMLTHEMRTNIETAFGVPVYNQYGCGEAGVSAFECKEKKLHLISSRCCYEISETGSLVGTDLMNDACIMLKFDTGDFVEFDKKGCSCGSNFPVIHDITGRSSDVVTDRNNKKIHSAYFNFLFKADKTIKQFQVVYDEHAIVLKLQVTTGAGSNDYHQYLDIMKANFDFDSYAVELNSRFHQKNNLKHSFIIRQTIASPALMV